MLELYYPEWEHKDFRASTKAIMSWISGKNTPNRTTFGAFIKSADNFPAEVKQTLWQLYNVSDDNRQLKAASDDRDFELIRKIVDVIGTFGTKQLNPRDAEGLIKQIREIARHQMSDEQARYADFYIKLALIPLYRGLGQIDDLMDMLQELEAEIQSTPELSDVLKGSFYHHRGVIRCYIQGDYQNAILDYQEAHQFFQLTDHVCDVAGVLVDIGMAHWCAGDLRSAELLIEKGHKQAKSNHCSETYLIATGNLGLVNLTRGKLEEALPLIQQHFELAVTFHHDKEMVRAQSNRGIVYFFMERYAEAFNDLTHDARNAKGQTEGLSLAYAYIGMCHLKMNDIRKARQCTEEALWIAEKNNLTHAKISALRAMAECAMNSTSARGYLQEALELAKGSTIYQEAACQLSLGRILSDPEEAEAYFQQGREKLERMGGGAWIKSPNREDAPFIMMV